MDEIYFEYQLKEEKLKKYEDIFYKILSSTKTILKIQKHLYLSVNFITDEYSLKLNKEYRNKEYVGDVISFPIDDEHQIYDQLDFKEIGDIFIAPNKAKEKSIEYNNDLDTEMAWLFTHGLLHILGYDHEINEDEEKVMFDLTDQILAKSNYYYNLAL